MTLFPYQDEGADFLAGRDRALLLDKPGLGKTVQACVAAVRAGCTSATVVCPAVARTVWKRHFREWAPDIDLRIVESYDKVGRAGSNIAGVMRATPADVLILDEAHYLKSPTAKRTKALYNPTKPRPVSRDELPLDAGIAHFFERVWGLTGTLCPNHAGEAWTHLRALGDEKLAYNSFLDRYCYTRETEWGRAVIGNRPSHLDELRSKLKSISLGRRLEDVGLQLPPITWGEWPVDAVHALDKAMMRTDAQYAAPLRDLLQQWTKGDFTDDEAAYAIQESEIHLATLSRYVGMAKAVTVAHAIADELRDDPLDKVILFARHHDVISELIQCLGDFDPAVVTGNTADSVRAFEIDRFQTSPRCRVFIGQLDACQTAITLTAANNVVFVESSWTPEANYQCAKRAHRIGQDRPVRVRQASLANTLDEAITRVLARKAKMIAQLDL